MTSISIPTIAAAIRVKRPMARQAAATDSAK